MRVGKKPAPVDRGVLALGLWAGFYLLAFGLVAGLVFFSWSVAERSIFVPRPGDGHLVAIMLAAGSLVAAGIILFSSFPRWHRFRPPGPRLDPAGHPALFDVIRQVARDCRTKAPDDVYLALDANAWVLDRGRFLGLFRRRALTIGVPILKVLTVSQLRSVIAHEFGHFVAGDTRLAPWVYRTHAALERTVAALEGHDSLWRFPFVAYANLFLRVSLDVSRRQEYLADELAARIAGVRATAEALKRTHRAGAALPAFANEELFPILNAGHRPPLAEGFARFMAAPLASKLLARQMSLDLGTRRTGKDDTHPPLALRLDALRGFAPGPEPRQDPPAIDLIQHLDEMEAQVLAVATGSPRLTRLPAVSWDEAAEKVLLPEWREALRFCWKDLKGVTPAELPGVNLTKLGRRIDNTLVEAEARGAALKAIGLALLVALRDRGWTLSAGPGERPAATRDGRRVEPLHLYLDLAEGKFTAADWKALCEAGQFGDQDLGLAVVPPPNPETINSKPKL